MFHLNHKGNITIRSAFISLILIITCIIFVGCTSLNNFVKGMDEKEEIPSKVKIGVFEPLSGEDKELGELERIGIELAHELYPEVLGKPVELVYGDNKSEVAVAETIAKEIAAENVSVVLGSYGNILSMTGGEVFLDEKIPALAITCTNPLVTSGNPYYFRVCFVDSFQGIAAAKYVFEDLNVTKTAVIKDENDDQAAALAQMFTDKMTAQVGEDAFVGTYEYTHGESSFTDVLTAAQEDGIGVVYLPVNIEDAVAIMDCAKKMGLEMTFIGTADWDTDEFLELGGSAVEGALFTSFFDAESSLTEMTDVFLTAYREKYGEDAVPDTATALAFDAYLVALDAITRAETAVNTEMVSEAIGKTKQFNGATGSITFDANGDPIKSVAVMTVEDGKFVLKTTAEPNWYQQ